MKVWVYVSHGFFSQGEGKVWETHKIGYTFLRDCCWEVQMFKNEVTTKGRNS